MTTPTTAAGRALLERESLNARSFTLIDATDILAIEAEARAAALDEAALVEAIRESLDANNAWEWDDAVNGVQTGFDGNKDVLAECIAADIQAAIDALRERVGWTP